MTKEEIDSVFARVRTWPLERQSQVAAYLRAIEKVGGDYWPLTDEDIAELVEADAEACREGAASEEEVAAVFGRALR